jgi:carbamoylphosphate synthase large subunit
MILGGGPNRIGQGIEFDYCCVHAALQLREDGFRNHHGQLQPETVSTDYDTSDRLYFEPLTLEDVLEVIAKGAARRRHRAVRRPDAVEIVASARSRGCADHRHVAGFHRHGRRTANASRCS